MIEEILRKKAINVLEKNQREFSGNLYTVPSPETYPHQWLWDSCFHAIAYSTFDIKMAKRELKSVVNRQFENGMIPHMNYWDNTQKFVDIKWGTRDTSAVTQPPLVATAVWKIYEKDKDKDFLEEMYEHIRRFHKYLINYRDSRGHGLIGIINPDESGEDNSPRFDSLLELPPKHTMEENFSKRLELVEKYKACEFDTHDCMRMLFWVKDVPFNSIFVSDLEYLAKISKELKKGDEEEILNRRQVIIDAMRKRMFEDGLFWSIFGNSHEKIKVRTWHFFAPLYAGILNLEEAQKVVYLLKDEFNCKYSVPTVSKKEESYDPNVMWRGPVWMNVNWFIFEGLKRYGFKKESEKILENTKELLNISGFREFYNPETGEGLGAKDFTWGALILDMNMEQ